MFTTFRGLFLKFFIAGCAVYGKQFFMRDFFLTENEFLIFSQTSRCATRFTRFSISFPFAQHFRKHLSKKLIRKIQFASTSTRFILKSKIKKSIIKVMFSPNGHGKLESLPLFVQNWSHHQQLLSFSLRHLMPVDLLISIVSTPRCNYIKGILRGFVPLTWVMRWKSMSFIGELKWLRKQ